MFSFLYCQADKTGPETQLLVTRTDFVLSPSEHADLSVKMNLDQKSTSPQLPVKQLAFLLRQKPPYTFDNVRVPDAC